MKPRITKALLTSHITLSVGWFGAVAVFLALAITGITSKNMETVRGSYTAMEISAWFIILPFCIASLITGIVQALITKWGLLNHYWIIVKLILTLGATILLILHLRPIEQLAHIAGTAEIIAQPGQQMQMIADSAAAIVVLLVIITISVYKPWGRTALSVKSTNQPFTSQATNSRSFRKWMIVAVITLLFFIIIKHLTGGGMHGH